MEREYLTTYLKNEGCYPDTDGEKNDVSELWTNCINSETCFIPFDKRMNLTTYCQVFYELKVAPPFEYESDYAVYLVWREHDLIHSLKDIDKDTKKN